MLLNVFIDLLSEEPIMILSGLKKSSRAEPSFKNSGFITTPKSLPNFLFDADSSIGMTVFSIVPGTIEKTVIPILESASNKKFGRDFGVVMNPEFLKEGSALEDFFKPDRIVIGSSDKRSINTLRSIYKDIKCPILETSFREAEMIKYAANAFLATKISFINEIGNICKRLGIDTNVVAKGIGMDKRISPHFLRPGIGFGGSCFPKDVAALVHKATSHGYNPRLLRSV